MAASNVTFWLCSHLFPHVLSHCTTHRPALWANYNLNCCVNIACYDCFTSTSVICSILCAEFMYFFVFTSNWWCVYSFLPEHWLIIEHMISMAAVWKTGMEHWLPQFKQKLNIINMVNATYKFLCKQNRLKLHTYMSA